jgi:hypothetical protein
MCGGATVFTPMAEYGVMSWMRTAIQFLAKFGREVTAISSKPRQKVEFAARADVTPKRSNSQ